VAPDGPSGTTPAGDPVSSDTISALGSGSQGRSGGWLVQAGSWWSRWFGARHAPVAAAEVPREAQRTTSAGGEPQAVELADAPVSVASDGGASAAARSKEV